MSEMIERALKALEQAEPKSDGSHTQTFSTPDTIRAGRLAMVRAVIEAMREPTQAMVDAVDLDIPTEGQIRDTWDAMIEAATAGL